MKSKYKNQINSKYVSDVSTKIRWKKTLDFLDFTSAEKALDVGDRTPLTDMMESKLGCKFQTTSGDLDELIISGSYEVITCFEVIEHLFNPLHFLLQRHHQLFYLLHTALSNL